MFNYQLIKALEDNKRKEEKKFYVSTLLRFVPLTAPAYDAIKKGKSIPGADTLERIAMFFGVDMNYFFDMETKAPEVKEVSVRMTDGNEYILKRFEELIAENAILKSKIELYERNGSNEYTLPDVQVNQVAENPPELIKNRQNTDQK